MIAGPTLEPERRSRPRPDPGAVMMLEARGLETEDAHWWRHLNYPLMASVLALCVLGWLVVYSADGQSLKPGSDALRQAMYMVVGFLLMAACSRLDYHVLQRLAPPLYVLNLALLLAVALPGIGQSARGAQRWISLGPLGTFQPSEPAKLIVILTLAAWLAQRTRQAPDKVGGIGTLAVALLHVGVPFVAILLQPDLGTAGVLVAVTGAMLFVAGTSPVYLVGLGVVGAELVGRVLKAYQRQRLLMFLRPETDPLGQGYSLIQSRTAIGSGLLWGQGLFHGLMSQHHFIPEHTTDFIFAVVGEELGLVGTVGLLLLYVVLLLSVLQTALAARDVFGSLLCTGVFAMLAFHAVINVGMTIGLMPVTGVPLPLLSYGGSALLTDLIALGLVNSVRWRSSPACITPTPDPPIAAYYQ